MGYVAITKLTSSPSIQGNFLAAISPQILSQFLHREHFDQEGDALGQESQRGTPKLSPDS